MQLERVPLRSDHALTTSISIVEDIAKTFNRLLVKLHSADKTIVNDDSAGLRGRRKSEKTEKSARTVSLVRVCSHVFIPAN